MKSDIYQQVTDRLIAQLEQGMVPWRSPYLSKVGFPRNFHSRKTYQGINVFLLGGLRFTSPYFLTFIQARELGGKVRKGERGHLVVKYGTYSKEDETAQDGETPQQRRFLKGYTVFNSSQIEGIEFPQTDSLAELPITEKTALAREIVSGMPKAPEIKEGSAVPCYRAATDSVHMPEGRFFSSEEAYYSTLFHELAHSTGHADRLARKSLLENKGIHVGGDTARKTYAEEELVAEMSASFLNAHAGILEDELANSASYLQGWIDALRGKDAKSWVIRAASQAQKAADFILDIEREGGAA